MTENSGKYGYGAHDYDDDADTTCNTCGYIRTVEPPAHTHSWATAWSNDETYHWHNCTAEGCDVTENSGKYGYGAHVYDNDTDTTCNTCEYIRTITPSHTHSWAEDWSRSETHHWHECTAEGCGVTENSDKDGYGAHDYDDDADTTCNTCGYERTITPSHTHSWATVWSKNETHHWHECTADGCDVTDNAEKDSYAEHAYDQEIATDEYKASDATCTAKATYYKSCVCGAKSTETFESGEVNASNHTGTLSGWQTDSSSHWKEYPCCGAKADDVAHTFKWVIDKEATTAEKGSKHEECTVCGYKKAAVEIPATGSSTGETTPDETNPDTGATTLPATGDNSHMALWFALLFVSGAGVIGTTVYGKKKRAK